MWLHHYCYWFCSILTSKRSIVFSDRAFFDWIYVWNMLMLILMLWRYLMSNIISISTSAATRKFLACHVGKGESAKEEFTNLLSSDQDSKKLLPETRTLIKVEICDRTNTMTQRGPLWAAIFADLVGLESTTCLRRSYRMLPEFNKIPNPARDVSIFSFPTEIPYVQEFR